MIMMIRITKKIMIMIIKGKIKIKIIINKIMKGIPTIIPIFKIKNNKKGMLTKFIIKLQLQHVLNLKLQFSLFDFYRKLN
jgi:hypothetical protein